LAAKARKPNPEIGESESRELHKRIDEFINFVERNPQDQLRQRAGRLRSQLHLHSDPKQAVQELEEYLLKAIDKSVDQLIERRAAQVAVGTSLATGLFDSIIVVTQAVSLINLISQSYSGRPGILGTIRLLRGALAIAVFAEVAEQATELLADALATKALAKLGGRLGQGLANGLLIARLGHAVKRQCRPVEAIPPTSLPVTALVSSVVNLTRSRSSTSAS
jgi:putative membrane protein